MLRKKQRLGTKLGNVLIEIPRDFARGEYELQIAIGGGVQPNVQFATELGQDGDYSNLTKLMVISI